MSNRKILLAVATLALAACSQAPVASGPSAPAQAPAPAANVASLGSTTANSATVRLTPPKAAYGLLSSTAHHWVAADILEYVVVLERQTAGGANPTFDAAGAVTVNVPVKGANPATEATFTNIPWGSSYRAFVTAKGNEGGVLAGSGLVADSTLDPMNATAGTTDFDFTAVQDVVTTVTHSVQVVFDATPFSGTGTVTFASPADGVYSNPSPAITGAAQ